MSVGSLIATTVGANYASYLNLIPNTIYLVKVKIPFGKMHLKKTKNTLVELIVIKSCEINAVHTGNIKVMIGYNIRKAETENATITN